MKRKVLFGLAVAGATVALLPLFAAFEAHVVNVTAKIENALTVPVNPLDFGTVFPQEYLVKNIPIALSQSFQDEDRVDDVEYVIRQKPKCAITWNDGTEFDAATGEDGTHLYTRTGHVFPGAYDPNDVADPLPLDPGDTFEGVTQFDGYYVDCGPAPRELQTVPEETWGVLPMLCPYLSKHEDTEDGTEQENDDDVDAFHAPFTVNGESISWLEAQGRLAKSVQDFEDNWLIDLAVPCFGGFCAQDWATFVGTHNANEQENADDWTQPIENQHKIFGCDLWFEVFNISLPGLGCEEEIDLMLVVDRSGSIGGTDMNTVKTGLLAFVDALMPSASGNENHIGQTSFSSGATLDSHLTDVKATIQAAINGLVSGGTTDMEAGITLAIAELDNAHAHERPSVQDVMVVISDGAPNQPDEAQGAIDAAAAADAARAAGIDVFAIGIGVTSTTEAFLMNEIADAPSQYFLASDFDDLESILVELTVCEE
ncbi:VWA domain-containing protein [Candidatus Parcubacteria bacterium]|nr:MAG: VWA domain-containing protein [Candidatus Parcubacteria bacterium]